jgi:hypothetical protein
MKQKGGFGGREGGDNTTKLAERTGKQEKREKGQVGGKTHPSL